jgi:hypothetical protein
MCDPFSASIALAAAGAGAKSIAQGQIAGKQKKDIAAAGQSYEAERTKQAGFNATNQATVGDTLTNYGRPNFDTTNDANVAKRQAAYTAPIGNMDFGAPVPGTGQSSGVTARNANTADAMKSRSLGEALAKGKLDAYGDTQQGLGFHAADNASNIGMTNRIASGSERAEAIQQGTLPSKLDADKGAGDFFNGIGDVFSAAAQLSSMGGAGGLGQSVQQFGARNGISSLSGGMGYVSPFAGAPSSGVYTMALPRI